MHKLFMQWLFFVMEFYVKLNINTLDPKNKASSLLMYFHKIY